MDSDIEARSFFYNHNNKVIHDIEGKYNNEKASKWNSEYTEFRGAHKGLEERFVNDEDHIDEEFNYDEFVIEYNDK